MSRAVDGDGERDVERPVRDVALADLDVHTVDEDHRIHRVQRPVLPVGHALHDPVGDGGDGLLGHPRVVHLGQVRGDLTVRQALGGQRDHQIIHPSQPALSLAHQPRLEAAVPIPRRGDLHRPRLG
jgi:hypothetical protein